MSSTAADVRVCAAYDIGGLWRETVHDLGESRLAHAAEWFTVIRDVYAHEPLYLIAESADGRRGVLPSFVVRRPLLGTVVVSMPFLDGGGPCGAPAVGDALVGRLVEEAGRLGARTVELRSAHMLRVAAPPMQHKVNLSLSLPHDAGDLWRRLDRGVRNQIRKAERSGLSIEIAGMDALDEFYAIFAARMRDLGSPVHARCLFSAIFAAFGRRARLVLARKGRTAVGGLIALAWKDVLTVPWASCLHEYFPLCPNMLLYWETIRGACAEGFRQFDFGRSSRGSGTYRFKRQWGAQEDALFWYTIPADPRRPSTVPAPGGSASLLTESWRHLPLAVTERLGPRIRKYLIQ